MDRKGLTHNFRASTPERYCVSLESPTFSGIRIVPLSSDTIRDLLARRITPTRGAQLCAEMPLHFRAFRRPRLYPRYEQRWGRIGRQRYGPVLEARTDGNAPGLLSVNGMLGGDGAPRYLRHATVFAQFGPVLGYQRISRNVYLFPDADQIVDSI